MTSSPKTQGAKRWSIVVVLAGAALLSACGASQGSAKSTDPDKTFVYAPRVGQVFRQETTDVQELSVPGSSFRESQEWRVVWEVNIAEEGDKYLYHRRLAELAVSVNGQPVLTGTEVAPKKAEIVQVMSKDGRVLDITGTEKLTEALTSLVPEAQRADVAAEFSPENLREVLLERVSDAFGEVVGKPSVVGQSWTAKESVGPLRGKTVVVDSALGCGGSSCRKLIRTFDIDQKLVGDMVRKRVAHYLTERGWDPTIVKVVSSNLKVEDNFVVEPATCHLHDSLLSEEGKLTLEGPAGGRIEIALSSKRGIHSEYPVAK